MKKFYLTICFLGCYIGSFFCAVSGEARERRFDQDKHVNKLMRFKSGKSINEFIRFESAPGEHTSQIVLNFLHPLYYEKEEVLAGEQIKLCFPGMRLDDFKRFEIDKKCRELPMVADVRLYFEETPVPRVVLSLSFAKNQVMLRLTKMEEPNLLVIDIFKKETLELLRKKVTTTLTACNDSVMGQGFGASNFLLCTNALKKNAICRLTRLTSL